MTQTPPSSAASPPPVPQAARDEPDPRTRLQMLMEDLVKTHNRRLIAQYLRLRHTLR